MKDQDAASASSGPASSKRCRSRDSSRGHNSGDSEPHAKRRRGATGQLECQLCGSAFTSKPDMDDHIRSHVDGRWYWCRSPSCTLCFGRQSDCTRHEELAHQGKVTLSDETDGISQAEPFNCEHCERGLRTRYSSTSACMYRVHSGKSSEDIKQHILNILHKCRGYSTLCANLLAGIIDLITAASVDECTNILHFQHFREMAELCEKFASEDVLFRLVNYDRLQIWGSTLLVQYDIRNAAPLARWVKEDKLCLTKVVADIVTQPVWTRLVCELEGDHAVAFRNLLQELLDNSGGFKSPGSRGNTYTDNGLPRNASSIFIKLARKTKYIPPALVLKGIEVHDARNAIGHGAHADVYRGTYQGQAIALKVLRLLYETDQKKSGYYQAVCREALSWSCMIHPRIVPFLGIDIDTFAPAICLVSRLMERGSLEAFIRQLRLTDMYNNKIIPLMIEVAEGIHYMHDLSLVHGDLRAANVLIDMYGHAYISDFGLAAFVDFSAETTSRIRGNPRWMAPELFHPECGRTPSSDMYSFGCVIVEILTGSIPFSEIPREATVILEVCKGRRPRRPDDRDFPRDISSECLWTFLEQLWDAAPQQRPTANEALGFLGSLRSSSLSSASSPVLWSAWKPFGTPYKYSDLKSRASSGRRRQEARFECGLYGCSQTFTTKKKYQEHANAHRDLKSHECLHLGCGKSFRRLYDCRRHEQSHEADQESFHCRRCGRSFTRKDVLQKHERRVGCVTIIV